MCAGLAGVRGQQLRVYGVLNPNSSVKPTTGGVFSVRTDGTDYVGKYFGESWAGTNPLGELLRGSDGRLYATTEVGGDFNQGVLYSVKTDGTDYRIVHHFGSVDQDGANPNGKLVQVSTGELIGTTFIGGVYGRGTVYAIKPDGSAHTVLHSFNDAVSGALPQGGVTHAGNQIFGTVSAGGNGNGGGIYTINADGTGFQLLYKFNAQGGQPQAAPVISPSDGFLYGTTLVDETSNPKEGSIYRIAKDGQGFQVIHLFSASNGKSPQSPLLFGADGDLYGTCYGDNTANIVYKINPGGTGFKVLHDFTEASLVNSFGAGLVQDGDGSLYGLFDDQIYRLNPDGTGFETLEHFDRATTGRWPRTSLTIVDGKFYGTLVLAGKTGNGRVFTYDQEKGFEVLFDFGPDLRNGAYPISGLTLTASGKWVTLTGGGGANDKGVMYAVDKSLNLTRLLDMPAFTNPDGYYYANQIQPLDHTLLGIGGMDDHGFIYSVQDDGTGFKKILLFDGANGSEPEWLVDGKDGWVYGATGYGGAGNYGVIFRMKPDGTSYTKLHEFYNDATGGVPLGSLMIASNGYLYGNTNRGTNVSDNGSIFRMKTDGTDFSIVHPMTGISFINYPFKEYNGMLYNTTTGGGASGFGAIFRVALDGSDYAIVYDHDDESGVNPQTNLTFGPDGRIYSASAERGAHGFGTLFSILPDGTDLKVLHDFENEYASFELVVTEVAEKASQTITFAPLPDKIAGDVPFTLSATASSGLPVTFTSDNTSIATVAGNTVTIHAAGEAVITATQAGNDAFAPAEAKQTLTVRLITGIDEYSGKRLLAYPNPSRGIVYMRAGHIPAGRDARVQVMSSKGNLMGIFPADVADGGDLRVDLSGLDAGLYLLKLAGTAQAVKVIKL